MPNFTRYTAILVSTAAAGLSGAVIAGAADNGSTTPTPTTPAQQQQGGPGGPGGPDCAGGPGRGHGPRADLAAVAKTLGVTEAKLKSALEAARPSDQPGKDGKREELAAAIGKALGESTSDVQSVLDANRPQPGPGGPGPGAGGPGKGGPGADNSALVTALAKKFSVSEAKVKSALEAAQEARKADHDAREDERNAAIAKALGKSADDVAKAFEAAKPAKPAQP